jgi:hypothetical protein
MKRSTVGICFILLIGYLLTSSCSGSIAGKYYLQGNDKTYIELKPERSNDGSFTTSDGRNGRYNLDSNTGIHLAESNRSVADGTIYKGVIEFTSYYGSKGITFIKVGSGSGGAVSQSSSATNKLTKEKVQVALDTALARLKQGGTATVTGILENPQENSARADIQYTNFQYDNGTPYVGKQNFTGQGFAVLSHYNDGRWVMTRVQLWSIDSITTSIEIQ